MVVMKVKMADREARGRGGTCASAECSRFKVALGASGIRPLQSVVVRSGGRQLL